MLDHQSGGIEPTAHSLTLIRRSRVVFDELRQSLEKFEFLSDRGEDTLRIGYSKVSAAGIVGFVLDRWRDSMRARGSITARAVARDLAARA